MDFWNQPKCEYEFTFTTICMLNGTKSLWPFYIKNGNNEQNHFSRILSLVNILLRMSKWFLLFGKSGLKEKRKPRTHPKGCNMNVLYVNSTTVTVTNETEFRRKKQITQKKWQNVTLCIRMTVFGWTCNASLSRWNILMYINSIWSGR